MGCCCDDKTITVYKGFPTRWNGKSLIDISFDTIIDLTDFSAVFKIGNIEKTYTNISEGFSIDLTKEETSSLPVGLNYGELIIVDDETHKKPFTTALPFNVEDFVSGDVHLDNYNATVTTKIKNVPLKITIETANVDPSIILEYIEEHNIDETAHPYIQGLIGQEAEARESADGNLQTQINEISILANGYVHEQGVASATWTINHNLNKFPSVSIVDSAGNEIIAEVKYEDLDTCIVTMTGASKGKAFLN